MNWTIETVQLLTKLWGDGLSASQIAAELPGAPSRSAVIGKVHRLGLPDRKRKHNGQLPAPRKKRAYSARTGSGFNIERTRPSADNRTIAQREADAAAMRELFASETTADLTPDQLARTVSLAGLTDKTCRWPLGDPSKADFCFCGVEPAPDKPYCAGHWRVGHQRPGAAHG